MPDGVTIDACVMQEFDREVRQNLNGTARRLIEEAVPLYGIVIDDGQKIQHEWLTTCQGPFFREWFVKQLYERRIKTVRPLLEPHHKKRLRELGLTQDPFDPVYIGVANATATKYIVSCDMHFFDPKLKAADAKAKSRAMDGRRGTLCCFLRSAMGVRVGTIVHAYAELVASKIGGPSEAIGDK